MCSCHYTTTVPTQELSCNTSRWPKCLGRFSKVGTPVLKKLDIKPYLQTGWSPPLEPCTRTLHHATPQPQIRDKLALKRSNAVYLASVVGSSALSNILGIHILIQTINGLHVRSNFLIMFGDHIQPWTIR